MRARLKLVQGVMVGQVPRVTEVVEAKARGWPAMAEAVEEVQEAVAVAAAEATVAAAAAGTTWGTRSGTTWGTRSGTTWGAQSGMMWGTQSGPQRETTPPLRQGWGCGRRVGG